LRILLAAVLGLTVSSCTPNGTPLSPASPSDLDPSVLPLAAGGFGVREDSFRIVHPTDGAIVWAQQPFTIILEQQLASGPLQGTGILDGSADGLTWRPLAEFPWSRQESEIRFTAILPAPTTFHLRVRVFEDGAQAPWIESDPVVVEGREAPPTWDDITPGVRG
jgi:hypothetical protein